MILILLAVEGLTLLFLRPLLSVHMFVGLMLIAPASLKLASTGYRFGRYYQRRPTYVEKGPPHPLMRFVVAPALIASTVGVLGTGVALLVAGRRDGIFLGLHKVIFFVLLGALGIHVIVYLRRLPGLLRPNRATRGGELRAGALSTVLFAGVAIGAFMWPLERPLLHHHHRDRSERLAGAPAPVHRRLAAASSTLAPSSGAAPCGFIRPKERPAVYRHVVTIILENHAFGEIAGHSPYLNRLAEACGLADNLSAITHPSLPNYLAITSGGTAGITDDCTSCSVSTSSIFGQVGPRGWRTYQESMPTGGFTGSRVGHYVKRHNPAAYYTKIAAAYAVNAVSLGTPTAGALISDLRANRLPRYSLITPNLCDDEHDCPVGVGDAWLARWVPRILTSHAYRAGGTVLFVTFDEGSQADNRVYGVVVSPTTRAGTVSHVAFTHYSLLKTQESLLGLHCLGHACDPGTASMRNAFSL